VYGTMNFRHALLSIALAALSPALSLAQVLEQAKKPLDYTKQADVNSKTVTYGDLHFDTISQPTRPGSTTSPLSKGDLQLQRLDLNEISHKSVDLSTISEPTVPRVNYTAKRAAADKVNDLASRQLDQSKQKAPITDRQIHAFTPGGQEELKKQLDSPVTVTGANATPSSH